jgi:outer membrane protein
MPKFKLRVMTAATLLALGTLGASLTGRGADLLEVYKQSKTGDAQFASARAAWAAAQEKLPQGRAGLLPNVGLSGNTFFNDRHVDFRNNLPSSSNRYNSNELALTLRQPIYRPQNTALYEQGKTQVEQADAILAQAEQDLITRVAQAYVDVLLARDELALAGAQKTAIAEQLAQAQISFKVGTATITDTHEAQARYDQAVAQEIRSRSDLEVRQRALELAIGKAAPVLAPLGPGLKLVSPEPAAQEKWVEEARAANPNVRAAQSALTFAQQQVTFNRSGHMPTLDAAANLRRSVPGPGSVGTPNFEQRTANIGLELAMPIYQGGRIDSQVREAAANEDKARQDLEKTRRDAELFARQNYVGVTSGISAIKALEAGVTSSQSALDSTRLGREVGVRTQVDVLNAQQQLFQARRDLARARYEYIMSTLRLKAAVGRLTEQDVVAINAWLDRNGK